MTITTKKTIMLMTILAVLMFSAVFSFAAADPAVTIVSPSQSVSGNNLLISVKMTASRSIKVYLYEEKEKVGDTLVSIDPLTVTEESLATKSLVSVSVMTPETFDGTGSLQFYNKQINDITPGFYRVKVETLDKSKNVTASSSLRTIVTAKDTENTSGNDIFQTQQTGALQWVQNLLKSIFKN